MLELLKLSKELDVVKSQLKNVRQEQLKQKAILKDQSCNIHKHLHDLVATEQHKSDCAEVEDGWRMCPIGTVSSCFRTKNGTPRQAALCPAARATLTLRLPPHLTNPEHALRGLDRFSHLWLLFVFHANAGGPAGATVRVPRLEEGRRGVFATRAPRRPNPLGLSLVHLDAVRGSVLHLSGVDLLDGTPVLDVKPFIPAYDIPPPLRTPELLDGTSSTNCLLDGTPELRDGTSSSSCLLDGTPVLPDGTSSSSCLLDGTPVLPDGASSSSCMLDGTPELLDWTSSTNCLLDGTPVLPDGTSSSSCLLDGTPVLPDGASSSCMLDGTPVLPDGASSSSCILDGTPELLDGTSSTNCLLDGTPVQPNGASSSSCLLDGTPELLNGTSSKNCLLDGTPVLPDGTSSSNVLLDTKHRDLPPPDDAADAWLREAGRPLLGVSFTARALASLRLFHGRGACGAGGCDRCLRHLEGGAEAALAQVLASDPRSAFRRRRCADRLYYLFLDSMHVTCWFDGDLAEVLKVQPAARLEITPPRHC